MITHGKVRRPFLGISAGVAPIERRLVRELDLLADRAVEVSGLEPRGPAEKSGVQAGDLIIAVNDRLVTSVDDLHQLLARLPVEVDYGSEFRYRDPILDAQTLTVCISQSGETADTIAAQREAKQKGSPTLAICNVLGSMITREAAGSILTHAGPEIGVASTKAFTAQLTALALSGTQFAIHLQEQVGNEWSFSTIVMSGCVITSAAPTSATISGAPTATFSGFSMHVEATDATGVKTSGPPQTTA